MTNKKILSQIKNNLATQIANVEFDQSGNQEPKLRCPNETERRDWMKSELRYIYFWGNASMPCATYKTLRGHIRHSQYDVVFRCLKNKRYLTEDQVEILRSRFEKYSNSKTIMQQTIKVTFEQPVTVVSFDIDVTPLVKGGIS